jgi:hypothetical protein
MFSLVLMPVAVAFLLPVASAAAQKSIAPFAGKWDLTLANAKGQLPSWIDVSEDNSQPKVLFVGVTDHATPLQQEEVHDGQLVFVSPKGQEGFPADTTYTLKRVGDHLSGTVVNSENKWTVTGERAPTFAHDKVTGWGKPVSLFNGQNLDGWKLDDPSAGRWTVENGDLISPGHGSDLISIPKFKDFKLHLEFKLDPRSVWVPGSNSGAAAHREQVGDLRYYLYREDCHGCAEWNYRDRPQADSGNHWWSPQQP